MQQQRTHQPADISQTIQVNEPMKSVAAAAARINALQP